MEGGELFQRIQDRQDGAFTERGKHGKLLSYCLTHPSVTQLDVCSP